MIHEIDASDEAQKRGPGRCPGIAHRQLRQQQLFRFKIISSIYRALNLDESGLINPESLQIAGRLAHLNL